MVELELRLSGYLAKLGAEHGMPGKEAGGQCDESGGIPARSDTCLHSVFRKTYVGATLTQRNGVFAGFDALVQRRLDMAHCKSIHEASLSSFDVSLAGC
jgi:hypothetical protein